MDIVISTRSPTLTASESSISSFTLCSVSLVEIPSKLSSSLLRLIISPAFTITESVSESSSLPFIRNITRTMLYRLRSTQNRITTIPNAFARSNMVITLMIPIIDRTNSIINGSICFVFFSFLTAFFPDLSVTWNLASDIPSDSFITGIRRNGITLNSYIPLHLSETLFPPTIRRLRSCSINIGSQKMTSSSQLHLNTGIINTAKNSGESTYIRFLIGEYQ